MATTIRKISLVKTTLVSNILQILDIKIAIATEIIWYSKELLKPSEKHI